MTLAVAYATVEGSPAATPAQLAAIAGAITREEDHVDPLELAQWIKDNKRGLRVIDVRKGVDTGTYVIPGAQVVPLDALSSLTWFGGQPRPGDASAAPALPSGRVARPRRRNTC